MAVPNTFASATSAIPLANLDANFAYYDAGFSLTGSAVTFAGAITLTSGTANGVPYLNASKVLTSGSVLTFDGTILSSTRFAGALNGTVGATTANTGAFTTLTTSSTVTISGGTANGVAYLNGSKVLTTGTALTFDGTKFSIGDASGAVLGIPTTGVFYGTSLISSSIGTVGIFSTETAGADVGPVLTFGGKSGNTYSPYPFAYIQGAKTSASAGDYGGYLRFLLTPADGGVPAEQARLTSSGLEVKQSQLIGYSSYSGIGTNGLAVAGNVGIGTSSPAVKLHVSTSGNTPVLSETTGGITSYLLMKNTGGAAYVASQNNNILFATSSNADTRAILDSSGNLGLGVTPSAWNTAFNAVEVGAKGAAVFTHTSNYNVSLTYNSYYNAAGWKYGNNAPASYYNQYLGAHAWFNAPSGTAGAAITFTQAMTLDASGSLVVGGTSALAGAVLTLQETASLGTALALKNRNSTQTWKIAVDAAAVDDKILAFIDNGTSTVRMALTDTGNLGLGVAPSAWTAGYKVLQVGPDATGASYIGSGYSAQITVNAYNTASTWTRGGNTYAPAKYSLFNGTHVWSTAAAAGTTIAWTEAMTLDASGNLLVGTTSSSPNPGFFVSPLGYMTLGNNAQASGFAFVSFDRSGTNIGSITQAGTTAVAYNTSSDYRLKNITGPITTSGAYIDSLKPVEGTWKADGSTFVGLIAHETQEASRTTVATGTKDGAEMQGMDYSSAEIIANLIAELQSVRTRLATLEAK